MTTSTTIGTITITMMKMMIEQLGAASASRPPSL